MTYISISDEIDEHCRKGRLFAIEPEDFRAARVPPTERRTIYVSPELRKFLESARPLAAETQADLADFVLGKEIDAALELDHQFCFMARLNEAADEVWEIRIWDTTPQLRLFGRFAECDVFVALVGPIRRSTIAVRGFDRIKSECKAEWKRLFGSRTPLQGSDDIHAYISANVTVV